MRRIRAADPLRQAKIFLADGSPLFARLLARARRAQPGNDESKAYNLRMEACPGAVEPRIIATER